MKKCFLLFPIFFLITFLHSFAQKNIVSDFEISNAAELKKLAGKIKKGVSIDKLFIGFDLTRKEFPDLQKILNGHQIIELRLSFEDAPTNDIVKNFHDFQVFEIECVNDSLLGSLESADWKNIELTSIKIDKPASIRFLPASIYQAPFVDIYDADGSDMFYYGFEKNGTKTSLYISKDIVTIDSAGCLSDLQTRFGSVTETGYESNIAVSTTQSFFTSNGTGYRESNLVPLDKWTLNSTQDLYLRSKKGSIIHVPVDAFVTLKGKPYRGYTDVFYREWNSMEDLVDSELPLYFENDQGDEVYFKTNGMYEIRAYGQNGEELKLDKKKSISVLFSTIEKGVDDYNLYSYNENSQQWVTQGTVQQNKSTVIQTKLGQKKGNDMKLPFDYGFDTTRYQLRWEDPGYINTIDYKKRSGKIPQMSLYMLLLRKGCTFSENNGFPFSANKNVLQPVFTKYEYNDSTTYVKMTFTDKTFDRYPELRMAVFGGFWLPAKTDVDEFKKDFFTYKNYHDFRLKYIGNGEVEIALKSTKGMHKVRVLLYVPNRKLSKYAEISYRRRFKRYDKLVVKREKIFDATITRKMSNKIKQYGNILFDVKGFEIQTKGLGLFNCDQEFKLIAKRKIQPSFTVNNAVIPHILSVQVVDSIANGIYSYQGGEFPYSPSGLFNLIITDGALNKYQLDKSAMDKLKNGEYERNPVLGLQLIRDGKEIFN